MVCVNKLFRIFFITLGLLFIQKGFTQTSALLETNYKINSAVYNKNTQELIYANDHTIYYADYNTLKVTDSVRINTNPSYIIKSIEFVNSHQPGLIIKKKKLNTYTAEFYEYPEDSLVIFGLNKKEIAGILPGYLYPSYLEKNPNQSVIGTNKFYKYQGQLNSAAAGLIFSYPDKIEKPSSGIIKKLKISPNGKEVALVYYDSIDKNHVYHYTLEKRSLPDLNITKSIPITNQIKELYFSDDSQYLIVKRELASVNSSSLSTKEEVNIYDFKDLSLLKKCPENLTIPNVAENKSVWVLNDGNIINLDYETKKELHNIWSNLTPFSAIDGFLKINADEILIYGNKGYGFSNEKNGFFKYSLSDNSIFSTTKTTAIADTLIDASKPTIQNNKFKGQHVQLDKKKEILLTVEESQLQFWSTSDKRKIYDLNFEKKVNPFISSDGKSCLLFEEFEGQFYNDFLFKKLNLETGIAQVQVYNKPTFDGLSSKCYNVDTDTWICSDTSSKLWEINSSTLTFKVIKDFNDDAFYSTQVNGLTLIPETNQVLFNIRKHNIDNSYNTTKEVFENGNTYDFVTNTFSLVKPLDNVANFLPVNKTSIITGKNKLINIKSGKIVYIKAIPDYYPIKTLYNKTNTQILLKHKESYGDSLIAFDFHNQQQKVLSTYKIPPSSNGHFLTHDGLHYNDGNSYFTYNNNLNQTVSWKNPKHLFTQYNDLGINKNGKLLFRNEYLVNLKSLEIEKKLYGFRQNTLLENDDVFFIHKESYNTNKPYFQFKTSKLNSKDSILWESKTYPIKNYNSPNKVVLSRQKNHALGFQSMSYEGQDLYLINLTNKAILKKKIAYNLKSAHFNSDGNYLILKHDSNDFPVKTISEIYSCNSFKLLHRLEEDVVELNSDQTTLHITYDNLVKSTLSAEGLVNSKSYYAREYLSHAQMINSKNLIVGGTRYGKLVFWESETSSPVKTIQLTNANILWFEVINNKLFVLSDNSEINIVNLDNLTLEATCMFFEKDDEFSMAWFTPKGYFKAAKTDIRNFHFVKDGKTFPLLNYELFLNRPDILMQKIGFTKPSTISIYKTAYQKRLTRNNFNEQTDFLNLKRPELELVNKNEIQSITSSNQVNLNLNINSSVNQIEIYINGIPVINKQDLTAQSLTEEIQLSSGNNQITIVGKDTKGLETDPVTLDIKNVSPKPNTKIYYLGIGVSKYQDSEMDLRFADKDVISLASLFTSKYEDKVQIDTLLNQNATKDNIIALKSILKQSSIDDTVIISFSGHGIIDEKSNFYFATHDIDFNNPSKNGISYNEIQNLLSDIPARKKLLLLDACHSGEIDNAADLVITDALDTNVKQYIPEGAKGSSSISRKKNGLNNSFELMQSLFYDLDRGNGSYVISAAGGQEFAYENEDWQNGVFTYSVINAINDLSYDTWDGESGIRISKLKQQVYESVKTLTNNKQKPTSRAENIEWDWILE